MKFATLTVATILFASAGLPLTALADAPSNVRVRSFSYAGSGCPSGSLGQSISADYRLLNLHFDSFIAEVGLGVPMFEARKNCQINIDLDYPRGWSFSIDSVDYRGYASLDRGVTGALSTAFFYTGSGQTARLQTTFSGPLNADYQVRDQLGLSARVWSPCGVNRALNLNALVRLDNNRNRRGSGLLTIDHLQTAATHQYGLVWRRC